MADVVLAEVVKGAEALSEQYANFMLSQLVPLEHI